MTTYHVWAEHSSGQSVSHPCNTGVYPDPTDDWSAEVSADNEQAAAEEGQKLLAATLDGWEPCSCRRHLQPGSDAWWGSVSIVASRKPYPDYLGDDVVTVDDALTALDAAGLSDLAGECWCVEGDWRCDTANMLVAVGDQSGEEPVSLNDAINLLREGCAPRGATPYPSCAESLLKIRRERNPGEEM